MLELSHKNLNVWKESLSLVVDVYKLTKNFPKSEIFGLTSQLNRAAISVISNISEGLSRSSLKEKIRFLEIARSSIVEIDTQFEVCLELKFCNSNSLTNIEKKMSHIFAMITALIKKIKLK